MSLCSNSVTARAKNLAPQVDGADTSPARFFMPSPKAHDGDLSVLARHMGFGKRRHAGVAGKRGAQHEHGDRAARPFAKPHAEIEQRRKAERFEQKAVARFGRSMARQSMVERTGAKLVQGRHGGGAHEAVEQHGNAPMPRRERGTENGGKLAPAQRGSDAQRIAEDRPMTGERRIDRLLLALEALIVEAGAVTGKARAATAEQRR